MLLIGILILLIVITIASNNYLTQTAREIDQKRQTIHQIYSLELQKLEIRWQAEADQIRNRIELSRILIEQDEARWQKFHSYLTTQSEFAFFSKLLIAQDNEFLFSYGNETLELQPTFLIYTNSWYESNQNIYRLFRLPISLGKDGQGSLILFKTVNNITLRDITEPDTQLHLIFHQHLLASSDGSNEENIRLGSKESQSPSGELLIQTDLYWPGTEEQPILVAHYIFQASYPFKSFVLRPLVLISTLTLLIWLGLGRWLTRTVKRVETLENATNDYTHMGISTRAIEQLSTACTQPDEISDLANATQLLLREIDSRNLEQKAYLDTLAMLEEAVIEIDDKNIILRASPGWYKLTRTSTTPVNHNLINYIHEEDRDVLLSNCKKLFSGDKDHITLRLRLQTISTWIECRLINSRDENNNIIGIRGILRDITQTYLHEKQITHMALHDALTGLPNRVLLEDRINISLRRASRTQQKVGICFIDIDHFKNVNDTLGHKSGDKLLLAFSERMRKQLREGDTISRWGGDEFVVLLPDMDSEQAIREVTQKILTEVQTPLTLDDTEFVATFSMGVAFYPDDGEDIEALFSQADRAMFYAKSQGRNQACFYRDMSSKGIGKKELYIQNRLANAIHSKQIQAWMQPVISAKNGQCTGVEILARWQDEQHGWISPSTFIPMAENLGLIHELGQQILHSSLNLKHTWKTSNPLFTIAINVSKRQLFTPHFNDRLLEEVDRKNISPSHIILEVTESLALMDVEHAADHLLNLKRSGFRIAIDDFGTGYSSLSQLHEMHVDELKIDISFVRRLHDPSGLSMTQAIINLARALNLKTVAEGVETEDIAFRLKDLGVDYLQGYYYGKPMPALEFERWLSNHLTK